MTQLAQLVDPIPDGPLIYTAPADGSLGHSDSSVTAGAIRDISSAKPVDPIDHTPVSSPFTLVSSPGSVVMRAKGGRAPKYVAPAERKPMVRWSSQSRTRMVKRFASLDYSPLYADAKRKPLMLTLTLPRDWESLVPTPADFQKMVLSFRQRLGYALDGGRVGPPGLWKIEFQRRGAPHLHLLTALPLALGCVCVLVEGEEHPLDCKAEGITKWVSRTWFEVVDSGDYRHLKAGTGIDWAESERITDAMRMAVYFSRHSAAGASKGYQNAVPELWLGQGFRFWGYWGLKPDETPHALDRQQGIEALRLMRQHYRATHPPVLATRRVEKWVREPAPDMDVGVALLSVLVAMSHGRVPEFGYQDGDWVGPGRQLVWHHDDAIGGHWQVRVLETKLVSQHRKRNVWFPEPTEDDGAAGHFESHQGRLYECKVRRGVSPTTGEFRTCFVYRRPHSHSLQGDHRGRGGFVLAPGATDLSAGILRAVADCGQYYGESLGARLDRLAFAPQRKPNLRALVLAQWAVAHSQISIGSLQVLIHDRYPLVRQLAGENLCSRPEALRSPVEARLALRKASGGPEGHGRPSIKSDGSSLLSTGEFL